MGDIRPCDTHIIAFIIFKIYMAVAYDLKKDQQDIDEQKVLSAISLLFKEGLEQ